MGQCQIWRSKHLGMCNCKDMLANDVELKKHSECKATKDFLFYVSVKYYIIQDLAKKINAWYCFSIKLLNNMRCMTTQAVLSGKIRGFCVMTMHVLYRKNKYLWNDYTNSIVHEDKGRFVLFGVFLGGSKTRHRYKVAKCFFLISW